MKILWFSHLVPYPPTGLGVLQRSYNLIRELARLHEVHVLGFIQRQLFNEVGIDATAGTRAGCAELLGFCKEVEFLPIPNDEDRLGKSTLAAKSLFTGDPYSINWLKSSQMLRTALEWRDRGRFDLVHFDTISLAPYHGVFAGHPTTVDHHNIESHMMLRRVSAEPNILKRLYFWQEGHRLARYEHQVCSLFNLHITCSRLDSTRLRESIPELNITEIPNGVDIDYFHPTAVSQELNSLVFAGNLSWYPNTAAMLYFADYIWPLLRDAMPGIVMNLIGAHPPERLKALAAADPNFRVHGFVPDVRSHINSAEVYVCPVMDGGGTKLKVLDALAMGKPLVANPVACEGIEVVDGETVLFAERPEDYVRHIATLLRSPSERMRMGVRGRTLIETSYSYAGIGRKLARVMEECVQASDRRPQAIANT